MHLVIAIQSLSILNESGFAV